MKNYANDMGRGTLNGVRVDGGAGSGNWGHVGIPGFKGGSASGGGLAFRGEATTKAMQKDIGKYVSQAKIRSCTERKLRSTDPRIQAQGAKMALKYNMEHKSYKNVTNYDPNASKNILANAKQSAQSTKRGVKGTKAMRDYEFDPKHTAQGQQSGSQSTPQSATQTAPKQAAPKAQQTTNNNQNSQGQQSGSQSGNSGANNQPAANTPAPGTSTPTQTGRPLSNPNYQKALAVNGDKSAAKQLAEEAKKKGKYRTDTDPNHIDSHYSDTKSRENGATQKLVNYMGLTEKPTVVSKSEFAKLTKGREDQVMFRGTSSSVGADQFINGECNRMGGIAYGSGVYFGGSKDGTFATSCGYGKDIKCAFKPDAKVLDVDGMGFDANGKKWRRRDSKGHAQYTEALCNGYDAVRIRGAGGSSSNNGGAYIVLWNRASVIVEGQN